MRSWLLLGVSLLVAAAGLGWMSAALLRLDERARVSENARLALWRMDLALARLISSESTRPGPDYLAGARKSDGVLGHFDVAPGGAISTSDPAVVLELPSAALPVRVASADEGTRNGGEFNRRNFFAMNNLAAAEPEPPEAAMAPAWYGDKLVLARRVRLDDGVHLQGAWLDWTGLSSSLLREVKDLLPEARFEPARTGHADALTLASLPLQLVPGAPADDPERTPIRWVIAAAWGALVLVALALGVLLAGTLSLDERRAAFVSAVTHELRTPLTTFKLYAEMLEEGMVPAEKQKEYLATLRQEANRLGYLVENVLAYAQLEGGRKKPLEALSCTELLARIIPRLQSRAPGLVVAAIPEVVVMADRVCVEQILFNLVDNACKYAPASVATISFSIDADRLRIAVSDDGPGVSAVVARRLFEPFRKSAAQAADAALGIGLGLALSRRLARAMGGELEYVKRTGSRFELSLLRVR